MRSLKGVLTASDEIDLRKGLSEGRGARDGAARRKYRMTGTARR